MLTERRVLPVLLLIGFLLCPPVQGAEPRDGQGDFDFSIGIWKTDLKRLQNPLTGSTAWIECTGTSVVSKIWTGRAILVELEVDCPSGHLQGLNLRSEERRVGKECRSRWSPYH